jgi:hypothetical protein
LAASHLPIDASQPEQRLIHNRKLALRVRTCLRTQVEMNMASAMRPEADSCLATGLCRLPDAYISVMELSRSRGRALRGGHEQAALWIASRSLSSGARSRDPLARNDEMRFRMRPIDPTGKSTKVCPALGTKIFRLTRRANQHYDSARLTRNEGRVAIVTNVAVGCGGRECCD